jgi:hypothetical protein
MAALNLAVVQAVAIGVEARASRLAYPNGG